MLPHLFKVDPHDDQEVLGALVRVGFEQLCVLDRGADVVNRARTDDLTLQELPLKSVRKAL